jgi:hypothetical protein
MGSNWLNVSEHFLQTIAQFLNCISVTSSHNSAHSSQIPIHNSAYLLLLIDWDLRAWNVVIQISAHSSTILVNFLESVRCNPLIFTSRSSQFIHASKHAFVWQLVIVISLLCFFFEQFLHLS